MGPLHCKNISLLKIFSKQKMQTILKELFLARIDAANNIDELSKLTQEILQAERNANTFYYYFFQRPIIYCQELNLAENKLKQLQVQEKTSRVDIELMSVTSPQSG